MRSVDSMSLEVTVREGTKMVIHPDQVRQWQSRGEKFADEFKQIQKEHSEKYEGMLASIIQGTSSGSASQVGAHEGGEDEDEGDGAAESNPDPPLQNPLQTFESLEKLQEADPVTVKVASEIAGVELLRTTSKKIFVMSEKEKGIPRFAVLGGFGTGKRLS